MSSGIPISVLGPQAAAYVREQLAAQRAKQPTAAQSLAISARTKKGKRNSARDAEEFLNICDKAGIPRPMLEYRFHPTRKWRFDFAWAAPKYMLALEVDGGVFIPGTGRHNSGAGFRQDCEKLNSAATVGWRVLRVFPEQLLRIETVEMVRRALRWGARL